MNIVTEFPNLTIYLIFVICQYILGMEFPVLPPKKLITPKGDQDMGVVLARNIFTSDLSRIKHLMLDDTGVCICCKSLFI
jgi:hypothetical protein